MKPGDLDETIRPLLPGYMTMGHTGMDMGRMAEVMPMPPNSIPMKAPWAPSGTTSPWVGCSPSSKCGSLNEL